MTGAAAVGVTHCAALALVGSWADMAWVKISSGAQAGARIRLDQNKLTAGRDAGNDIELRDSKASRRHLEFVWVEDHYEVVDLDSKNGTRVNGVPVERRALSDGDWIEVGGYVLIYESETDLPARDVQIITGWLRVVAGPRAGATFLLGERTCTAGRDPGNVIQLVDDDTSRRHVQFKWTGQHYEVQDLSSTNGTFVNEARIDEPVRLDDGDLVQVGAHALRFELLSAARYRDETLRAKDVRVENRVEQTKVMRNPLYRRPAARKAARPAVDSEYGIELHGGDADSFEHSVEVGHSSSIDFEVDVDLEESLVIDIEVESGPDLNAALGRLLEQARGDSPLADFWAAMLDLLVGALEPDRALLLAFKGPSLVARGIYAEGRTGHRSMPPDLEQGVVREVLSTRRGLCVRDLLIGRGETPARLLSLPSTALCAPLKTMAFDCGVVYLDRLGPKVRAFSDHELNFLRNAAGHIAEGVAARQPP